MKRHAPHQFHDRKFSREMTKQVHHALDRKGHERLRRVHCDFQNGTVFLWGSVADESAKRLAEEIVWGCRAVEYIENEIMVDVPVGAVAELVA